MTGRVNDTASAHRNRAAELGLRMTSTGSCPRRLVRLPHRPGHCWCETRLNDHGRRYRTVGNDTPVVMWEPYPAAGQDVARVVVLAEADGLLVTITGASPWNPGETFALIFEAAV